MMKAVHEIGYSCLSLRAQRKLNAAVSWLELHHDVCPHQEYFVGVQPSVNRMVAMKHNCPVQDL